MKCVTKGAIGIGFLILAFVGLLIFALFAAQQDGPQLKKTQTNLDLLQEEANTSLDQ